MNSKSSFLILAYAIVLLVSGVTAHLAWPEMTQVSFITALVGGVACGIWGVLSLTGRQTRGLTILTLVGVAFTLLSQTILTWASVASGGAASAGLGALITALFVLSIALLMFLAYTAPSQSPARAG